MFSSVCVYAFIFLSFLSFKNGCRLCVLNCFYYYYNHYSAALRSCSRCFSLPALTVEMSVPVARNVKRCVDCDALTEDLCAFPKLPGSKDCLAASRLPQELWQPDQRTPFCHRCKAKHGACYFCRQDHFQAALLGESSGLFRQDADTCFVSAGRTKDKQTCEMCHVVKDFLAPCVWLCAVCFRHVRLSDKKNCTCLACCLEYDEHLSIFLKLRVQPRRWLRD